MLEVEKLRFKLLFQVLVLFGVLSTPGLGAKWPTVLTGSLYRGYTIRGAILPGGAPPAVPVPPTLPPAVPPPPPPPPGTPLGVTPTVPVPPTLPPAVHLPPVYDNPQRIVSNSLFDLLAENTEEIDSKIGVSFPEWFEKTETLPKEKSGVLEIETSHPEIHLWFQSRGFHANTRSTDEIIGHSERYVGIAVGGDREWRKGLRFGISYSRGSSTLKTPREEDQTQTDYILDTHLITFYGSYTSDLGIFVKAQLHYAEAFIDKSTYYDNLRTFGKNKAYLYGEALKVGYTMPFSSLGIITPAVGFSRNEVKSRRYEEYWPSYDTPIKISSHKEQRFRVYPSISFHSLIERETYVMVPGVYFQLRHVFSSRDTFPRALTLGETQVLFTAEKLYRTTYVLGGTLSFLKSRKWHLDARYGYNFIPGHRSAHTASLQLTTLF